MLVNHLRARNDRHGAVEALRFPERELGNGAPHALPNAVARGRLARDPTPPEFSLGVNSHRLRRMASGAPATEPVVVEMVSKDATSDADEMSITESKIRAKIAEMRDMLEGGRVMSVARDPETAYGQSNLAFKDLSFSIEVGTKVKTKQVILTPSSGAYAAGSMVAIMGPSGCGKTTLLDMLAGKKTAPYTGEVFLNGKPRDRLFPRVTSYVAQHDVMPPYCTVAEAIEFNHRLRVDSGRVGNQLRWMFVDEALAMFGPRRCETASSATNACEASPADKKEGSPSRADSWAVRRLSSATNPRAVCPPRTRRCACARCAPRLESRG